MGMDIPRDQIGVRVGDTSCDVTRPPAAALPQNPCGAPASSTAAGAAPRSTTRTENTTGAVFPCGGGWSDGGGRVENGAFKSGWRDGGDMCMSRGIMSLEPRAGSFFPIGSAQEREEAGVLRAKRLPTLGVVKCTKKTMRM